MRDSEKFVFLRCSNTKYTLFEYIYSTLQLGISKMGLFDKFMGRSDNPIDNIKNQLAAAGIDPQHLRFTMSGTTLVIAGTVSSEKELKKLNSYIDAVSNLITVNNRARVEDDEYSEDDEYDEDSDEEYDEDEDYAEDEDSDEDTDEDSDEEYDYSHVDGACAQLVLEALGYELGRIDGIIGAKSRAAIKAFQRDYELDVTGELDEYTQAALGEAFYNDVEELSPLAIQLILEEAGYDVGGVDGVMGPKTKLALRNFQEDQELDPTGKLDEDTIYALKAALV